MKKFLLFVVVTCVSFLCVVSVKANESEKPVNYPTGESSAPIEPKWWPGDPNPEPGSEAWLQLYGGYKTDDPGIARECALNALKGGLAGSSAEASVTVWIQKAVFTVFSFAKSFGIGFAVSYLGCITGWW